MRLLSGRALRQYSAPEEPQVFPTKGVGTQKPRKTRVTYRATFVDRGKAVARIGSTLALPIGPTLAKSFARARTRRVFLELHPAPFRNLGGARRSSNFSPAEGGVRPSTDARTQARLFWLRRPTHTERRPNKVPFRRNPEQLNFTGKRGGSQGDCARTMQA